MLVIVLSILLLVSFLIFWVYNKETCYNVTNSGNSFPKKSIPLGKIKETYSDYLSFFSGDR